MNDETIPESRVYRHGKCATETVVAEESFVVMSNPLSHASRTWCCQCSSMFPIAEFEWADTGESLPDYYARHSANATLIERFLCTRAFFLAAAVTGLLAGAAAGFGVARDAGLRLKILATAGVGFVGLCVAVAVVLSVGGFIARLACGVRDTRTLK